MLRVGLTGGIGSGKSTVSARWVELGAVVVDADRVARQVVEPGEPALAAIAHRFGEAVLREDGSLDRARLGRIVFGDPGALGDLERITHPAIWERTAALLAAVPPERIAVHDMPLLVEKRMAGEYHLTVVVGADVQTRVRRLVELRGMPESDASARIAAQADDAARRAAADVWIDNGGSPRDLARSVERLWAERLVPFEANLHTGTGSRLTVPILSDPDPGWPDTAARLLARIRHAVGDQAGTLDHIGSTAVPGLRAKDVVDLQVGVRSLADADTIAFLEGMAAMGFPRDAAVRHDNAKDGTTWSKRYHRSCDPGRVAHVHVREIGSPGWRWALLFRDWLRADAGARQDYEAVKEELAHRFARSGTEQYAQAKEPWFDAAHARVEAWATATGWRPAPG